MKNTDYVTASEIGDYIFCKRGWWLNFNGLLPKNEKMLQGTLAHENLARRLLNFDTKKTIAFLLIVLGILLIILYFLVSSLLT
jgi:CRISPR/Cas system-associated exonuclease Cas4 (RecB family)